MSEGPLRGIRVVELTFGLAGPRAGMHLGDMGAEVVKIEPPAGDEWREHEAIPGHPGRSRHYMQANRNKRAVCLDLTMEPARAAARDLVRRADVLITNLRPGAPERLGLGWEDCRARDERLIYCAMSAYGPGGPLSDRGGYDVTVGAYAGLMPAVGATDERPPAPTPFPATDTAMPLLATTGILAALLERGRTGRGQLVEVSMLGTAIALNAHALVRLDEAAAPPVSGFARAFFRAYRTADGWIAVAALSERLARRLCAVLGMPGLLEDAPYGDRAARAGRDGELAERLAARFRERPTAGWDAALAEAGVPAAPVRGRDELFDDPQVRGQGLVEEVDDPEVGRLTMAAPAVRLSASPGSIRFPGRHLGADTREVLRELGRSDAEIAAMEASGAAVAAAP
ncbi:MAG: hypothetical protein QOD86_3144 [Miltoncostaeaceae bacterium]|nr:hypothetical protein [Miltoncostaeaceae bacterium]